MSGLRTAVLNFIAPTVHSTSDRRRRCRNSPPWTAASMLVVSWNVAGWEPTLKYIVSHYGSLDAWLDRHQIDVLCLQEVKIGREKLTKAPATTL